MLMNFAEEPNTPPEGTPPEEPKTPEETPAGDPAPAGTPAEEVDPQKARIDALQNSLDAALAEIGNNNEPKPADPKPADPTPAPAPAPEPAKPAPAPTPAPEPKGDDAWRKELDELKKGQEEFRNKTLQELENMRLKDEMISLSGELQAAAVKFPEVDSDRILYEIESGSEKTVAQIAAELSDQHKQLIDKIRAEQEEKIKTALEKENEGKIKVPQSSGTSSTPSETPGPIGPAATKANQDAAWAQATKAAKANLQ